MSIFDTKYDNISFSSHLFWHSTLPVCHVVWMNHLLSYLMYHILRQLPYWIDGNVRLTETKAILRHIARTRLPSLLGITPHEMAEVEMLAEVLWDMWNSLCQICLKNDVRCVSLWHKGCKSNFLGATFTLGVYKSILITFWNFLFFKDSAKDDFLAVTKTKLQLLSKSYTKEWISGSNVSSMQYVLHHTPTIQYFVGQDFFFVFKMYKRDVLMLM